MLFISYYFINIYSTREDFIGPRPLSSYKNGKGRPKKAQGQDVFLCLLRSDMQRGAQEEKPRDSSQLFRILQKMLCKMEG